MNIYVPPSCLDKVGLRSVDVEPWLVVGYSSDVLGDRLVRFTHVRGAVWHPRVHVLPPEASGASEADVWLQAAADECYVRLVHIRGSLRQEELPLS